MQPARVALPRDYDTSPGRFRLAQRTGREYLTGGPALHERIRAVLTAVLARFVPPAAAARAADRVPVPLTVTKRGALVWARA